MEDFHKWKNKKMKNKHGNKRLTLDLQNCYRIELTSNFANPTYKKE